ncbi:hypothetical protein [Chitinilyticum aquatile]|uniref:hypothetical protein n=1 Tax=Chitinilyticum aquatile TaxID=362520 RepID=UPI0003FAE511|nr:hypothetical protein [Chitinilyticum aquatile]
MALLVDFDAQLCALARLIEMEVVNSGGYAQNKYGESGGGGYVDMLPSGLVYQVSVRGFDGRKYTFPREKLEQTAGLIRALPNPADRQTIELVYLTYGSMKEKASHIGIHPDSLARKRNQAVERFAFHWQQFRQGQIRLPRGMGVLSHFVVQEAANAA